MGFWAIYMGLYGGGAGSTVEDDQLTRNTLLDITPSRTFADTTPSRTYADVTK